MNKENRKIKGIGLPFFSLSSTESHLFLVYISFSKNTVQLVIEVGKLLILGRKGAKYILAKNSSILTKTKIRWKCKLRF